MTDIQQVVSAAQAQDSFDVLAFIEATNYPTDSVVIFTDVAAVKELSAANKERLEKDASDEPQDYTEIDEKIATLTARINATALKFEVKGMPPALVESIYPGDDNQEDSVERERTNKLVASSIVAVTKPNGAKDSRIWTPEDVEKLRGNIQGGEFGKLVTAVVNVNFNAAVFDQATDAGFLSRSLDVAP